MGKIQVILERELSDNIASIASVVFFFICIASAGKADLKFENSMNEEK